MNGAKTNIHAKIIIFILFLKYIKKKDFLFRKIKYFNVERYIDKFEIILIYI